MSGHRRKSRCTKFLHLHFLQALRLSAPYSSANALDSASSGKTGSQTYKPDRIPPDSRSPVPAPAGTTTAGTRRRCHLHIPSRQRSWSATGQNTRTRQLLRQFRPLCVPAHFYAHRSSPANLPEFCIYFDTARNELHPQPTAAALQGQTFLDFGHEFLQTPPDIPCRLCEYIRRKATAPSLFPGNAFYTFYILS